MRIQKPNFVKIQLLKSIKYKKCWVCGCQHSAIGAIKRNLEKLDPQDKNLIDPLILRAEKTFQPVEYDCLECKTCYPANVYQKLTASYPLIK